MRYSTSHWVQRRVCRRENGLYTPIFSREPGKIDKTQVKVHLKCFVRGTPGLTWVRLLRFPYFIFLIKKRICKDTIFSFEFYYVSVFVLFFGSGSFLVLLAFLFLFLKLL